MRLERGLILGPLTLFQLISAVTGEDQLICPKSWEAKVGENVTLDCYLEPQRDVTRKLFEWKFNESYYVLVHRSRGFSHNDQAEQFRYRAHFDSNRDLTKGKLPLEISSVQTTDAGRYSCSVGKGKEKISCNTELIIIDTKERDQIPSPTEKVPKEEYHKHYGLSGIFIGAVVVIALICLRLTNKRESNKENTEGSLENRCETESLDNMATLTMEETREEATRTIRRSRQSE